MIVMKFGGTSMGSADSIKNVAEIIRKADRKNKVAIVVSAVSGMTNLLIETAKTAVNKDQQTLNKQFAKIRKRHKDIINELFEKPEETLRKVNEKLDTLDKFMTGICLINELSPHSYDFIQSYGERLSVIILSDYLKNAVPIEADEFLIIKNQNPLLSESKRNGGKMLNNIIKQNKIPIITGFLGRSLEGKIATLGRGGSDYSASIVGTILEAKEIQIWTDVAGIYTTDPGICPQATPHKIVSFREASELARFGAKVLHPRTIAPAIEAEIPIFVKNTFEPENQGTKITFDETEVPKSIKAITAQKNVHMVTIESSEMLMQSGFLSKIFHIFAEHDMSVDIVATSEITVSVTIENRDPEPVLSQLRELGEVTIEKDLAVLCVIGTGLKENLIHNANILKALADNKINAKILNQGQPQSNFSIIINEKDIKKATLAIHNAIFTHNRKHKHKTHESSSDRIRTHGTRNRKTARR